MHRGQWQDKHTEFTAEKFRKHPQLHFKTKCEPGHSHLPSRAGLDQGGGGSGDWRGEQTSLFSCPQHDLLRSLSLPACPHLSVFRGLPTRGSQYIPEDVRVAPISPHICPYRTAIYILIQHPWQNLTSDRQTSEKVKPFMLQKNSSH